MCSGSRLLFNAPSVQHRSVWPLPLQDWLPLCSFSASLLPIGSHAYLIVLNSPCTWIPGLLQTNWSLQLRVSPAHCDMQLASLVLDLQPFMGHLQFAEQHIKAIK